MLIQRHSLTRAVEAGLITEQAAFCGLSPKDLGTLAITKGSLEVVVRLRGRRGDARMIMTVRDLLKWTLAGSEIDVDGLLWEPSAIRDVMAVAL